MKCFRTNFVESCCNNFTVWTQMHYPPFENLYLKGNNHFVADLQMWSIDGLFVAHLIKFHLKPSFSFTSLWNRSPMKLKRGVDDQSLCFLNSKSFQYSGLILNMAATVVFWFFTQQWLLTISLFTSFYYIFKLSDACGFWCWSSVYKVPTIWSMNFSQICDVILNMSAMLKMSVLQITAISACVSVNLIFSK